VQLQYTNPSTETLKPKPKPLHSVLTASDTPSHLQHISIHQPGLLIQHTNQQAARQPHCMHSRMTRRASWRDAVHIQLVALLPTSYRKQHEVKNTNLRILPTRASNASIEMCNCNIRRYLLLSSYVHSVLTASDTPNFHRSNHASSQHKTAQQAPVIGHQRGQATCATDERLKWSESVTQRT
jgi:hypothetical protein